MKTECHCIYCPLHPLHKKRARLEAPTGYDPTQWVMNSKVGREVNCLEPVSAAFDAFDIDPELEEFETTAYGEGASMTGFERDGITLYARCKNEGYEA